MIPRIGLPEALVLVAVFVLLFGARRLPDLVSGLGKAVREFRRGVREEGEEAPEPGEGRGAS